MLTIKLTGAALTEIFYRPKPLPLGIHAPRGSVRVKAVVELSPAFAGQF